MKRFFVVLALAVLAAGCADNSRLGGPTAARSEAAQAPQPSAEVRDAQQRLNALGLYAGSADGLWGPDTQAAVERFQRNREMTVTSRLDGTTLTAIHSIDTTTPLSLSNSTDVRTVQNRLRQLNFFIGQADGVWGSDTQLALENFQKSKGIRVGQLTEGTAVALGLDSASFPTQAVASGQPFVDGPTKLSRSVLDKGVVRNVQTKLRSNGFYSKRVDGVWGPATQSAIQQFQKSRGLEANGQLNPLTLTALGLDPNNLSVGSRN